MKANSSINSLDLSAILENTVQSCIYHFFEPDTTNNVTMINGSFMGTGIGNGVVKWPLVQDNYFNYDTVETYGGLQVILDRLKAPNSNPTEDIVANLKVKALEYPISDLYLEEDGTMRIEIAITGFDPKNIQIGGVGSKLVIRGKLPVESKPKAEGERKVYGKIKVQDFELPYECGTMYDTERTKASVVNGILIVRVPLKEECAPKKFSIDIK